MIRDPPEDGVFFRVFYRNLALLHLRLFFLLPFIVLLQSKHATLTEKGENLISTQPRISAHSRAINRINTKTVDIVFFARSDWLPSTFSNNCYI